MISGLNEETGSGLKASASLPELIQYLANHLISKAWSKNSKDVSFCEKASRKYWQCTIIIVLRLAAIRLSGRGFLRRQYLWLLEALPLACDFDLPFEEVNPVLERLLDGLITCDHPLSALYEAVLNLVPCPVLDDNGFPAIKVQEVDRFKKRRGSFYSPHRLARLLTDNALSPLISERSNGGQLMPLAEAEKLKILDPSMGAGVFLICAFRRLKHATGYGDTAETSTDEIMSRLAVNSLHGVDLDPLAVEVARLSLWLEVSDSSLNPVVDFPNLKVGNSLIGAGLDQAKSFPSVLWKRKDLRSIPESCRQAVEKGFHDLADWEPEARLNAYCALFFMTKEELVQSNCLTRESLARLNARIKFFHWQLEFPEVFDETKRSNPGFDAVIGNPPWEIEKPNSREFFGMADPNFWGLGKQEALIAQKKLLDGAPQLAQTWTLRQWEHAALVNWIKQAPVQIQIDDTVHPFRYQGSGDLNLYKLFLEQSYYLTRSSGIIALIVPAGIYSDSGTRELRSLLLARNQWLQLVGFENSDGAFPIHRSFKYCSLVVRKDGATEKLQAAFLQKGDLETVSSWCEYDTTAIKLLSRKWSVITEVESRQVLATVGRIYQSSACLGEFSPGEAVLSYARELDMTLDSSLFRDRLDLEGKGYRQDIFGNWLQGNWVRGVDSVEAAVPSVCGNFTLRLDDLDDVYVPLYEGRMVGQFTANEKHWISGKGRRAIWQNANKDFALGPQYLVDASTYKERSRLSEFKIGFLAVGSPSNSRTMIATLLSRVACGNSVPVLFFKGAADDSMNSELLLSAICACLNSFVFDFVIRRKMSGNNLNYFVVEECPLPKFSQENRAVWQLAGRLSAYLSLDHPRFANELIKLGFQSVPSCTDSLRRRLRAYLDVLVASLYNLDSEDMQVILSSSGIDGDTRTGGKGFHRVDRGIPASERLPALVLRYFEEMESLGLPRIMADVVQLMNEESQDPMLHDKARLLLQILPGI